MCSMSPYEDRYCIRNSLTKIFATPVNPIPSFNKAPAFVIDTKNESPNTTRPVFNRG